MHRREVIYTEDGRRLVLDTDPYGDTLLVREDGSASFIPSGRPAANLAAVRAATH